MKIKVYYHEFNWLDDDGNSIVLYSPELGWLEYFDNGFFAHYDKKNEIFEANKCGQSFKYLGEL